MAYEECKKARTKYYNGNNVDYTCWLNQDADKHLDKLKEVKTTNDLKDVNSVKKFLKQQLKPIKKKKELREQGRVGQLVNEPTKEFTADEQFMNLLKTNDNLAEKIESHLTNTSNSKLKEEYNKKFSDLETHRIIEEKEYFEKLFVLDILSREETDWVQN